MNRLAKAARSLVLGIALAAPPAGAQVAAPPGDADAPTLPAVVVDERRIEDERLMTSDEALERLERTPGGVALVPAARIDRTRAATLEETLSMIPGVFARARGVGEEPQLSVRGSGLRNNFHTRGVNVLIDGFAFQNADGFSDVESFEMLALKHVQVFKGSTGLRFGSNTLGGAINMVTRTGRDLEGARVRAEGGGYGFFKSFLEGGGSSGPWDVYGAVSYTMEDGYRDHARSNRQRAYGSLGRAFDGGASLRLDMNYVRNKADLPGALTNAEFRDDARQANPASVAQNEARDFDFGRGALTLRLPLSETKTIEWANQINYQDLYHPLAFSIIDNQTWNGTSELRYTGVDEAFGLGNRLSAGLQVAGTRQPEEFFDNQGGHRGPRNERRTNEAANIGLYAEDELELGAGVSLVGGGRLQYAWRAVDDRDLQDSFFDTDPDDSGSVDFFSVTPSLGLIWDAAETAQVYASVSRAYEPPLLFELTSPGNINGSLDDLDAQRAWTFELGTRGSWEDRVRWELALYDMEIRDEIRNVNVDPTGQGFFTIPRYENADRTRHFGLELGGDVLLLRDALQALGLGSGDALHLAGAYAWSRFRYVDDDVFGDNHLPGVPEHFVQGELRFEQDAGFWLAPGVEWAPRGAYVTSDNVSRAPGYVLWNLRAGWDHEPSGLGVFASARNLTNRKYVSAVVVDAADGRSFEPGAGRAVTAGVSWRWQ